MNKKAIAILGAIFLLIVGTLGFLIYSKYSAGKKPVTNNGNNPTPTPTIVDNNPSPTPTTDNSNNNLSNNSAFFKLTNEQIQAPALFYDGSGITYFDASGHLYQANLDQSSGNLTLTNQKPVDVQTPGNFSQVLWPSRGDHFMLVNTDARGNNNYTFYNSNTREFINLPRQVTALDWMPSGDRIIYIWLENGKATLNIGDPDTKNWQLISDMWETDDAVAVSPDGANIAYYETNNPGTTNKLTLTTPDGKIWKDLAKEGYNFGALWSPDSQKLIFSKKDRSTGKYQLWYYGITSGEVKNLGLFTTVDKAIWDKNSTFIFAAVPQTAAAGTGSLTVDTFYKINTQTSERQEFKPDASQNIDGRYLILSNDGTKIFFKNFQDGALYYLDLTK